ncbi:MAG TPA: glycerophosphodiester phosphodiesterase [Patescibacteria group bacterium]|nr:glycerophosphodiester phosphodiesterase [Patescibacteria group bacterium]
MPSPLILAHRGDWTRAAENSLDAFVAALRGPGVDGVEFDVRAARDGTPVVIHDSTLGRLRGVRRRVRDVSVGELRELGVRTLAEILEALPAPFFLDIELKEDIAAQAIPVITGSRGDPPRAVAVSSFDAATVGAIAGAHPDWRCWLIARRLDSTVIARAHSAGCGGIAARWPALGVRGRHRADAAGLELATWTVDDPDVLRRLREMALAAICVDPPAIPEGNLAGARPA